MSAALRCLVRDQSGLAMLEFALSAPIVLAVSMYGIEFANLATTQRRVSQIAMTTADNMSRVGLDNELASGVRIREADINDALAGAMFQSGNTWGLNATNIVYKEGGIDLAHNGRVIISSLESYLDTPPVTYVPPPPETSGSGGTTTTATTGAPAAATLKQFIHWQRCDGLTVATDGVSYAPRYGLEGYGLATKPSLTNASGVTDGMGEPSGIVKSPDPSTAVIFVEVFYKYQPLFPSIWSSQGGGSTFSNFTFNDAITKMHYTSSYIVRDKRNLGGDASAGAGAGTWNSENVAKKTC